MLSVLERKTMTRSFNDHEAYLALVNRFPLVPIRTEKQNDAAAEVVDELLERFDELTAAEKDYFEVLSELIETFESRWKEELDVTPRELLKFLMEQNSLYQTDLIPEFGSSSRVSEYLAGRRELSIAQIQKLAARFSISPSAFIQPMVSEEKVGPNRREKQKKASQELAEA